MRVSGGEAVLLQNRAAQFVVEADHLVQQLRIFDMVALLVAVIGQRSRDHLLVRDVLEVLELVLILPVLVVEAAPSVRSLREEAGLARDR